MYQCEWHGSMFLKGCDDDCCDEQTPLPGSKHNSDITSLDYTREYGVISADKEGSIWATGLEQV